MHPFRVGANHRYFVDPTGKPVFWLGTTQWQLFREFSLDDARVIIERSRAHGINVIQVMLLGVGDGTKPNLHGEMPCHDNDPRRPNEAYFRNVDAVMEIARGQGVAISMTVYHQRYRERITVDKARAWAEWLSRRYKGFPNLIWSSTPEAKDEFVPILRELAAGLRAGDGGGHMITFKPDPSPYSSSFIHEEPWLDFNSMQTWADVQLIYPFVTKDHGMRPTKPVVMAEGAYEAGSEYGFDVSPLWVRRQAYYSCLAGSSHTYGHNDSWRVLPTWRAALDAPGARQMGIMRKIFEARDQWWELAPDQDVLAEGGRVEGKILNLSARHRDGRWAMAYLAEPATVSVRLDKLAGSGVAQWIDPRDGKALDAGHRANSGAASFTTPAGWEDAVLVLTTG
ncbi:MAG: DUF4038 domain-containing protein [Phycisphaeraceae bacterium]|nr:DUF4038 domain-containing protein [Phycisphaeraceae bacterium]